MSNVIKAAHIFKTGQHPGANAKDITFTEATLDGIVAAFDKLKQSGRVPLKFGHADLKPGAPALGWVERIWRSGADLFGDFTDMPTAVFEAVKKGLYKFVSIELLKNAERDGQSYPFVLDSVALLGADPPAVDGIGDLQKLLHSRDLFKFEVACNFTRDISLSTGDDDTMDAKEMQKAIADALAPFQTQINALGADLEKAKGETATFKAERDTLAAKVKEAEAAANAGKIKMARESATSVIEAAVRAKRITPAQREVMTATFGLSDDTKVLTLDIKQVEAMCGITSEEAKKVMEGKSAFSRAPGSTGGDGKQSGDIQPISDTMKLVYERQKQTGKDLFACLNDVARTNPEVAQAVLSNFTAAA